MFARFELDNEGEGISIPISQSLVRNLRETMEEFTSLIKSNDESAIELTDEEYNWARKEKLID